MRVLIADSHDQVRWALRTVIGQEPDLVVVGEVATTETLLSQIGNLQPDLVVLEWELPGDLEESPMADLRASGFNCRVIVLGRQPQLASAALAAGADAFMSKTAPPQNMVSLLRTFAKT